MKKILIGTICLLLLISVLSGCETMLNKDVAGQAIAVSGKTVMTGSINVLSCNKLGKIVNAIVNTSKGVISKTYVDQCHPYDNAVMNNSCQGTKMVGYKTICPTGSTCISEKTRVYCKLLCSSTNTLQEGTKKTYTFNNKNYEVTAPYIEAGKAKLVVNSEVTNLLLQGQSYSLADSSKIILAKFSTINGIDQVDFCINGVSGIEVQQTIPPPVQTTQVRNQTTTCTDTDGGKNYTLKGECYDNIKYFANRPIIEYCIDNSLLNELYCREGYCDNEYGYKCPNGCKEGACIQ